MDFAPFFISLRFRPRIAPQTNSAVFTTDLREPEHLLLKIALHQLLRDSELLPAEVLPLLHRVPAVLPEAEEAHSP